LQITGKHSIALSREIVWAALLDPVVIKQALPGCDQLVETGQNAYQAQINIRVGPVTGAFESRFSLTNLKPPESYKLIIQGRGQAGFLDANGEIRLEENGEATLLHYHMDASVGGRVASFGQRLIESTGRLVARQGLKKLDAALQKWVDQSY
jgi:carbon monoxide dehydrogenase subunit G